MTQESQEPWGAALRTYEVALSHDLVDEDFPAAPHRPAPLVVEPLDVELVRSGYIASLPEFSGARPGWRSAAWQGAWAQRPGGLSVEEALWWWRAWCAPAAWTDARADHPGLWALVDEGDVPDAAQVLEQWRGLIAACEARLTGRSWWFGLMWAPRLWLEWLSPVEVVDLLVQSVPAGELRHMWGALACRRSWDDERLVERVSALLPTLRLDGDEGRYTALRLLEVVPAAPVAPLIDALLSGVGEAVAPEVARAALALVGDQARVARCLESLPFPVRVESVGEVLAWGGYEGLGVWCRRLCALEPAALEPLLPMLLQLHAPQVVPALLMLLRHVPTRRAAYGWLIDEGANAIAGLLDALDGPCGREAERMISEYVARGHADLIQRVSAGGGDPHRG